MHRQGAKVDVHRLGDFGCDWERNATRYRRLHEAVGRLPIKTFVEEAARDTP